MKIRLTYTVDVDPEMWKQAFGIDRSELREDVHAYFRNLIQQSAASEETELEVVN